MNRFYPFLACLLAQLPALAQGQSPAPATGVLAQYPLLSCLVAAVVGAVVGAWATRRVLSERHRHHLHLSREKARAEARQAAAFEVKPVKPPTDYELKFRKENEVLKKELAAVKQQLEAARRQARTSGSQLAKAAPATVAAPPLATATAVPPGDISAPAIPSELLHESNQIPEVETAATPEALNPTRYAPVQETGFLRDSKLATEPLPQLPLLLTLSAEDLEKATFTLNPHVNQAKLIGDGLHQLREFFDFDLPTGRIAGVSADEPGQLARQGDGWQVVSRARLLVR